MFKQAKIKDIAELAIVKLHGKEATKPVSLFIVQGVHKESQDVRGPSPSSLRLRRGKTFPSNQNRYSVGNAARPLAEPNVIKEKTSGRRLLSSRRSPLRAALASFSPPNNSGTFKGRRPYTAS